MSLAPQGLHQHCSAHELCHRRGPRELPEDRYEALKPNTLFRSMEYTEDRDKIAKWAPLIVKGRDRKQRVAATRAAEGTDVDFGALTRELTGYLRNTGAEVNFGHDVTNIHRASGGGWDLSLKHPKSGEHGRIHAKFVFVGAGGGALHLLQASGIPESKGYGGFPVSGQFFRCTDQSITSQHSAKVYGRASVGAPPMSVPTWIPGSLMASVPSSLGRTLVSPRTS